MNICFYGVGGVGGYFGALVAKRFENEHNVYFIARGKHKEAICKNGITLKKSGGAEIISAIPKKCTNKIDDLPTCDLIILSIKGYDLENAVNDLLKITDSSSVILPLLNGVDIYDRIRKFLQSSIVLTSCVYIGAQIESPGIISQNGGIAKILMGYDPKYPDFYPESLLSVLDKSKIGFAWEDNIQVSIWTKYMFIAPYALVSANYDKTLGAILSDPVLCQITKSIMYEIEMIAKKLNIPLPTDIVDTSFFKAKQFPFETTTSLQRDIESKGKLNELGIFSGTIIRLGEDLNIDVTATKKVQEELHLKINRMNNTSQTLF